MSRTRRQRYVWLCLMASIGTFAGFGCSDDETKSRVPGKTVSFTVPPGGGQVAITLRSGNEITFDFPANASGKAIELVPRTSADIGWSDGRFTDVIELLPKGLTFTQPVVLRSKKNDLMVLHVSDANGAKSAPELLPLAPNGEGVQLSHFSAIAFIPPSSSCDTGNGWHAQAAAGTCQDAGEATTALTFQCDALAYCFKVTASCCVNPERAADGCRIGDQHLTYVLEPAGVAAAPYPWCPTANAGGQGGATQWGSTLGGATQGSIGGTNATQGGYGPSAGGTSAVLATTSPTLGGTSAATIGSTSAAGFANSTSAGASPIENSGGNLGSGGSGNTAFGGNTSGGTSTLAAAGTTATGGTQFNGQGGTTSTLTSLAGAAGWVDDLCLGWTSTELPSNVSVLNGVAALTENLAVAVGSSTTSPTGDSAALVTYDTAEGEGFSVLTPAYGALTAVSRTGDASLVTVGSAGTVLTGSYAGGTWTLAPVTGADAPTENLASVWALDATHFWVGGSGSSVYYYNGTAWEDHSIVMTNTRTVRGIWGTSATDVWVVQGFEGCPGTGPWHYSESNWTAHAVCFVGNAIWGAASNDIWSVGYVKGAFSHFTGNQWSSADSYGLSVPSELTAVRGRSSDRIWAVGKNGAVAAYNGAEWKMCNVGSTSNLSAVDVSRTRVWAVGAAILLRSE